MNYLKKAKYSYQQDIYNCKKELSFQQVYLNILQEEVAKDYFTPEPLLNDIVNKCFWNFSENGYLQIYPLQKIIEISNNTLKNKWKFLYALKHVESNKDFAINIIYLKHNNIYTYSNILNQYKNSYIYADTNKLKEEKFFFNTNATINQLKNIFFNKDIKGINLNSFPNNPKLGCLIVINGQLVKTHREFQQIFDHQLNHYFTKLGFFENYNQTNYKLPKIKENKKINQLLNKYYNFNSDKNYEKNIKIHLYNDNQFYPMCSTVFHTILKEIQKFNNNLTEEKFLNMLSYTFINQTDFLNDKILNYDLREAIIFCYINKELAPDRFQIIKRGIHTAFSIKKNIFQKFFIKAKDIIRNLICQDNK